MEEPLPCLLPPSPFFLPQVQILFQEVFFNSRDESYQVLCIDRPLEGGCAAQKLLVVTLRTAKDCEEYLWQSGEFVIAARRGCALC